MRNIDGLSKIYRTAQQPHLDRRALGQQDRPAASDTPTAIVSHFWFRYSPGGLGHVAVVRIYGDGGFHAVCTNNPEAAEFIIEQCFHRIDYFSRDLPFVDTIFAQTSVDPTEPAWLIEADGRRIVTRWCFSDPPMIACGIMRPGQYSFTSLFFIDDSSD